MQVAYQKKLPHGIVVSLSVAGKVTGPLKVAPRRARNAVVQTVRRDHFDTVISHIKEPYRTMMILQWAVGLRPGEACRMRLADVDLETGDLVTPRDGKTGERRLCFDTEGMCAAALREWSGKRSAGPYLFGGTKPVRVNTYNITLQRCCKRVGVPPFRPYALRHTYATELIHERQAISDISAALGHHSVLTTAAHYLHADPETMRRLNKGR